MLGDKAVWLRADHHAHMSRPQKSVDLKLGAVENGLDGWDDGDVIAEQGKIVDALALRLENRERRRWHRGFEPEPEEDNLLLRIEAREFERVEGGIDHAHISAPGFRLQQALLRARHPHRITEGCEDHARRLGKRDAIVDPPHWQHANWASGSMHEFNRIGQHSLDSELEDRMRVAAAHLPERERPMAADIDPGDKLLDFPQQRLGLLRIAELVYISHRLCS